MAVELYDEHEQGERVRNWIKEYGASILIGLVLAFAGIFGFRFWQGHQIEQQALAADYFTVIQSEIAAGQIDAAQQSFSSLSEQVGSSSYVGLAAMILGAAYVEDGRLDPAARLYRDVLDQSGLEMLKPVATLRLAKLLDAQGDTQGALELIGESPMPGFEAAWNELRGDLLFASGQMQDARLAYQEAIDALGGQLGGQRMLQMKLDATGVPATDDGESS
jgi:predicted negative regulator of RcsB-dependent stress response